MEPEEQLAGGNMSAVARVGNTVRREAGPWSPLIQKLLAQLRARGIAEVPEPLGFDEQCREVLSFLPGTVGHDPLPESLRSEQVLVDAARLLRRIHDASAEIAHLYPTGWQAPTRQPVEVICHGDFAPYNCVFDGDRLVGVFDFDHAHPGPRLWDLAYALYRFAPVTAPSNPDGYGTLDEQCRRTRLFCDAYGLDDRSGVLIALRARIQFMADFLIEGAKKGDRRLQANIDAGHLAIYTNDLAYLEDHLTQFQLLLK
jgi:hypothetical protein